jgi:hypothetical protein
VAANIEAEALMLDGAADPADLMRILLDQGDGEAFLAEQLAGGEPGRPRPDDRDVDMVGGARHAGSFSSG